MEELRRLVSLQQVDKTLYELEQEQSRIPARLVELKAGEDALKGQLDAAQAELEAAASRRKELDREVESARQRLRKADSRLMGAKTDREYRAANAEIQEGKDSVKGTEDLLLELMERLEVLTAQVKELEARHAALSGESHQERELLEKRALNLEAEIKRLNEKRTGLTREVDRELLSQYDFIRKARQGVALAPAKNGTCLACHMQLPPQQFIELMKQEKIMSCPTCRRLLYWAEASFLTEDADSCPK